MGKYSNKAQIVSSCYARQCHPETCCCRDDEAAIMDYVPSSFHTRETYYAVVKYGTRLALEAELRDETE